VQLDITKISNSTYMIKVNVKAKAKLKLSLGLTKHHAMKIYWGQYVLNTFINNTEFQHKITEYIKHF